VTASINRTSNDGQLYVYAGDGTGAFVQKQGIRTPYLTGAVLITDLNEDGLPDVAAGISSNWATENTVAIYLGQGAGSVSEPTYYPAPTKYPYGVSLRQADINNDGLIDLVVGIGEAFGGVQILLAREGGPFETIFYRLENLWVNDVEVGDVNNDGALDLFVAGRYQGYTTATDNVAILLGDGSGIFTVENRYSVEYANFRTAILADLDENGTLDAVLASDRIVDFKGTGDGSFSSSSNWSGGGMHWDIAGADINGDSTVDFVSVGLAKAMTVWISEGNGSLVDVNYRVSDRNIDVDMADVNQDGRPDAIIGNASRGIIVALNKGQR